jgi:transcriptional regulator with XRE-family HTH domain
MAGVEQIKIAKLIGKRLRISREQQGYNLAILASKLKMSVVQIVAIEDGNIFSFNKSIDRFSENAQIYAKELGLSLEGLDSAAKQIRNTTAKEWSIEIPAFLRKRD